MWLRESDLRACSKPNLQLAGEEAHIFLLFVCKFSALAFIAFVSLPRGALFSPSAALLTLKTKILPSNTDRNKTDYSLVEDLSAILSIQSPLSLNNTTTHFKICLIFSLIRPYKRGGQICCSCLWVWVRVAFIEWNRQKLKGYPVILKTNLTNESRQDSTCLTSDKQNQGI